VIRVADRVGKGIRNAPRDALIAESVDPSIRGRAFGFHRAAIMRAESSAADRVRGADYHVAELRTVFWLAAIPACCRCSSSLRGPRRARSVTVPHRARPISASRSARGSGASCP
jgi:hypothetical protein